MQNENQKRIIKEVKQDIHDKTTGEQVSTTTSSSYTVNTEPDYIKLYLHTILDLTKLSNSLHPILYSLLRHMSYANQNQIIIINSALKRMIARELGCTFGHVNNSISKFVKVGFLIRIDTGMYQFNAHLFGRGKWEDIKKIQSKITYEAGQVAINTEFEHKTKEEKAKEEQQKQQKQEQLPGQSSIQDYMRRV